MYKVGIRDYKTVMYNIQRPRIRIEIYNEKNNEILHVLECGIETCSISISAESDVRRTASLSLIPLKNEYIKLCKDSIIWINRIIKLYIGIYDNRYRSWKYYPSGSYVFTDYGFSYNETTNSISLSLADMWINFDGSRNGKIGGAESIIYPAYEEDETTGEVIKYHYIRDQIITTLLQLGKLKESQLEIDDVGEYKGMPDYNENWEEYREQSNVQVKDGTYMQTWNALPYDMEYSVGVTVSEILTGFRDLYPNYEMYFD